MITELRSLAMAVFLGTPAVAATLTHEYNFGSGTVSDSQGGLDGSLQGGAEIVDGALVIDGVNGYAELAGFAVPQGLQDFSVALRARQETFGSGFVEMISQGFSGGNGFYIGYDPMREFRLTDEFGNIGVQFPTDEQYHEFVLTSSPVGTDFYIDGETVFSSVVQIEVIAGGQSTRFGRQFDPFGEYFHGELDDIRVYSGALSSSEVRNLYTPSQVPIPASLALLFSAIVLMMGLSWTCRSVA